MARDNSASTTIPQFSRLFVAIVSRNPLGLLPATFELSSLFVSLKFFRNKRKTRL